MLTTYHDLPASVASSPTALLLPSPQPPFYFSSTASWLLPQDLCPSFHFEVIGQGRLGKSFITIVSVANISMCLQSSRHHSLGLDSFNHHSNAMEGSQSSILQLEKPRPREAGYLLRFTSCLRAGPREAGFGAVTSRVVLVLGIAPGSATCKERREAGLGKGRSVSQS